MTADPWSSGTFGTGALDWSPGLAWQDDAACREVGPDLFHSEVPGETAAVAMAKRVCNGDPGKGVEGCSVKARCLEWALEINDGYAVLGGMSPRQRQRLRVASRREAGGLVRCRVCRRLYVAASSQQDCSDPCRLESRRRREARRRTQ